MNWPLAEQAMTTSAVRRLLQSQYPSLAERPLRRAGEGLAPDVTPRRETTK
ncbi:MAG TPA: hypothetical protein VMU98_00690 [Acidimicrobiales bacterium]|nr:hypothetical protein [Acidimicrobiales bacterium]